MKIARNYYMKVLRDYISWVNERNRESGGMYEGHVLRWNLFSTWLDLNYPGHATKEKEFMHEQLCERVYIVDK